MRCSKAVPLLLFFSVRAFVVYYGTFVLSLFVPHHSLVGVLERLCFVIVAFPGYPGYLYLCKQRHTNNKLPFDYRRRQLVFNIVMPT